MPRFRRLWLVPAVCIAAVIYYLFLREHPTSSLYPFNSSPPKYTDGRIHWTKQKERYPVKGKAIRPPPGGAPKVPRIQYDFEVHPEAYEDRERRLQRQAAVRAEFVHAWEGYKSRAWTKDEVAPVSGGWRSSFGGWGATMVDSLDTLLLMGLDSDFEECLPRIAEIDFTTNSEDVLNVFESTIRYIGGLLSAYDLTEKKYKILLVKAQELAEVLFTAFDTPNRMPNTRWDWKASAQGAAVEPSQSILLAELGSMTLEFTRLSQLTGEAKYYDAIGRVTNEMEKLQLGTKIPGLWPTVINAKDLTAAYNHFTMGGMADSTYEYLPKLYLLMNGRSHQARMMWDRALTAAKRSLFFRPMIPSGKDILVSGNAAFNEDDGKKTLDPEAQHLTCFLGGTLAIGSKLFKSPDDLVLARRLVDGCIWAYDAMPSGLMPETFRMVPCHIGAGHADDGACTWNETRWLEAVAQRNNYNPTTSSDLDIVAYGRKVAADQALPPGIASFGDVRYILRPEAIESMFILYRITGDPDLQEHAWRMFEAIVAASRTEVAHAALVDVRIKSPVKNDRMESFWMAETLKYFYLIFAEPGLVSLDRWILNTEAHPLRRPPTSKDLRFGG